MPLLPRITSLLRNISRKAVVERELSEEVSSYAELLTRAKIRAGLSETEARRAALIELGGAEQVKQQVREARAGFRIDTLLQDLRYAARSLRKNPAFSLTAIATLMLGIGASAAMFTVVRGVLLKSLPYPEAERLVAVGEVSPSGPLTALPYQNYFDWRAEQTVFTELSARMPAGGILIAGGQPERVFGRHVSASFFPTLGVSPQLGRFFTEAEDRVGGEPVIVISDELWRRVFGGDPAVLGTPVQYNGSSWMLIGVMPRGFDYYGRENDNNGIFVPLGQLKQQDSRGRGYPVRVTARLKEGVSLRDARAEMLTLAKRSALAHPQTDSGNAIEVRSFLSDYLGNTADALWMISAGVVLLLLIACANVANLTLARAIKRQREIALRLAVGASRLRVIRLLLTESVLLALIGGAAGTALAIWGVEVFKAIAPDSLPRIDEVHIDGWVLAVTTAVTLASGILFGLAPAWQTTRPALDATLKQGGHQSSGGAASTKLRGALVIAELALSLTLLIAAGLLVQSFRHLMDVDPGYDARNVLTFRLRLPDMKYADDAAPMTVLKAAQERLQGLPGVKSVAVASGFPLGRAPETSYWIEGEPEPKNAAQWPVSLGLLVSDRYHDALGIPLLAGRSFSEQDRVDTPQVVLVDEEFVRRNFAGTAITSVIGRRLRFEGDDEPWREIVGVVRHVKHRGLAEQPRAGIYRPWTQVKPDQYRETLRAMDVIVKTGADPLAFVPAVRREIQMIDPDQPLGPVATLESLLERSVAPRRFNLFLLGTFSCTGLLLGVIGLYGVMSYTVSHRTREIGLRMALGAQRGDVVKLVLGEGLLLAVAGAAIGLAGAFALTRLMSSLLFVVSASDPLTYGSLSLLIIVVALLACYLPARRASAVEPMEALRYE